MANQASNNSERTGFNFNNASWKRRSATGVQRQLTLLGLTLLTSVYAVGSLVIIIT